MENFVCRQEPCSQAFAKGLHESISNSKEILAYYIEFSKVDHDSSQDSCKNIEAHIKTIMAHLKKIVFFEEVVRENEEKSRV